MLKYERYWRATIWSKGNVGNRRRNAAANGSLSVSSLFRPTPGPQVILNHRELRRNVSILLSQPRRRGVMMIVEVHAGNRYGCLWDKRTVCVCV